MKIGLNFRAIRRFTGCQRGAAIVEIALIASLLGVIAIGAVEFVAVSGQASKVSNAARAAVAHAAIDATDVTGITEVAVRSGDLDPATLTVNVNQYCECPGVTGTVDCDTSCSDSSSPRQYVSVNLSQPAESFLQAGGLMPGITLDRTATLRTR